MCVDRCSRWWIHDATRVRWLRWRWQRQRTSCLFVYEEPDCHRIYHLCVQLAAILLGLVSWSSLSHVLPECIRTSSSQTPGNVPAQTAPARAKINSTTRSRPLSINRPRMWLAHDSLRWCFTRVLLSTCTFQDCLVRRWNERKHIPMYMWTLMYAHSST